MASTNSLHVCFPKEKLDDVALILLIGGDINWKTVMFTAHSVTINFHGTVIRKFVN